MCLDNVYFATPEHWLPLQTDGIAYKVVIEQPNGTISSPYHCERSYAPGVWIRASHHPLDLPYERPRGPCYYRGIHLYPRLKDARGSDLTSWPRTRIIRVQWSGLYAKGDEFDVMPPVASGPPQGSPGHCG